MNYYQISLEREIYISLSKLVTESVKFFFFIEVWLKKHTMQYDSILQDVAPILPAFKSNPEVLNFKDNVMMVGITY
jgi:hypothetical protein